MTTGDRMTNRWNDGDLPAPYAEGDVIHVPEGAEPIKDEPDVPPGRYKVVYVASVDEGDAWYVRLGKYMNKGPVTRRLRVVHAARSSPSWENDIDHLAGCTLVKTADPDGLALRERMLAGGWSYQAPERCPTCGREMP